jgi:hypothetical protein
MGHKEFGSLLIRDSTLLPYVASQPGEMMSYQTLFLLFFCPSLCFSETIAKRMG